VPVRWSARLLDAALVLARGTDGSARLDLPGGSLLREYDVLRWAPEEEGAEVKVEVRGAARVSIRRWERGDRMRPASLAGRSRKLSDLYTDRKVPARLRPQAVVIVSQDTGEIVWAEHVGNAIGQNLQVALTRSHIPANSQ